MDRSDLTEPIHAGPTIPRRRRKTIVTGRHRITRDLYRGMIVVADDDDGFRNAAKEFFEVHRYLVLTARSGTEALARMRGLSGPTIAIVDLVMPGADGWHVIKSMHEEPDLRHIPIIVLSGSEPGPIDGVAAVLRKPYSLVALLERVGELLPP